MTKKNRTKNYSVEVVSNLYAGTTGYGEAGASYKKKAFKSFNAKSSSPNSDINYNLNALRNRSRMLYMSGGIGTAAIKTTVSNVVGVGLTPNPCIDFDFLGMSKDNAKQWQQRALHLWDLWANNKRNCDSRGMCNFYQLEEIALLGALMNGDSFALIKRADIKPMQPLSLRLDVIEADLVSTPKDLRSSNNLTDGLNKDNNNKIYNGVEVDDNGLIEAYHICNQYPLFDFKYKSNAKWKRIQAFGEKTGTPNILHICKIERGGQYRGVPLLAQILEPLLQMRRYTESELMAALVNSFFTAFIITEKEEPVITDDVNNPNNNLSEEELTMGPGAINQLEPGEDIRFADPNHPNSGFDTFMKTLSQICGSIIELPAEVILKAFNSNYSASRAAINEAWKMFLSRRVWFASDFCQPTWEMFIDEAVARNYLSAPGYFTDPLIRQAYLKNRWAGSMQAQLDPVKEVQAEILKCQNGFSTRKESTIRLNGGNFEANVLDLEKENALLKEANNGIETDMKIDNKEEKENDNTN